MTNEINRRGPYFIEIVYDEDDRPGVEAVRTAAIDGFQTAKDAWAACAMIRIKPADAIGDDGHPVTIAPRQVLQIQIGRIDVAAQSEAA